MVGVTWGKRPAPVRASEEGVVSGHGGEATGAKALSPAKGSLAPSPLCHWASFPLRLGTQCLAGSKRSLSTASIFLSILSTQLFFRGWEGLSAGFGPKEG